MIKVFSVAGFAGISALTFAFTASVAQEAESATVYGDRSLVTQDMLNRAAGDGKNFLHTKTNYAQTR